MSRAKLLLAAALPALALLAAPRPRPWLIWNATASAPIGLYRLDPRGTERLGDLVAAQPPPALARWLAARGYLPLGVPLIKPLAARAGDTVCRSGDAVFVDGGLVAFARDRDRQARPLPRWNGCLRLSASEVFLLNPERPDSFDGRYFGPIPIAGVLGPVRLLWRPAAASTPSGPPDRRETAHERP